MTTVQLFFDVEHPMPLIPGHLAKVVQEIMRSTGMTVTVRPYTVPLFLTKDGACRLAKDWMVGKAKGGFNAQGWADQYGSAESIAQHAPHTVTVYTRSGGYPGHAQLIPPLCERKGYPSKVELREDEVVIYIDEPDTITIPTTLKYVGPKDIQRNSEL